MVSVHQALDDFWKMNIYVDTSVLSKKFHSLAAVGNNSVVDITRQASYWGFLGNNKNGKSC